jgi:hypothetical protein
MKDLQNILKFRKQPKNSTKDHDEWALLEHKRVLSQDPPKSLLKYNKQFGSKYLPLECIEFILNAMYIHHEIVMPFPPMYVEGQILSFVNIVVYHPVSELKLTYSGQACVPLIAAEHENMKYNHRNVPASHSFAIMNAAKKIGNIFNAERGDYSHVMEPYFSSKQKESPEYERLKRMIVSNKVDPKAMLPQLDRFLEKKVITKTEYSTLKTLTTAHGK